MRVTSKGQVTIPAEIRDKLGLLPDTEVVFQISGGRAVISKLRKKRQRGQGVVAHMRGRASTRMSTDEIMALTRGEK